MSSSSSSQKKLVYSNDFMIKLRHMAPRAPEISTIPECVRGIYILPNATNIPFNTVTVQKKPKTATTITTITNNSGNGSAATTIGTGFTMRATSPPPSSSFSAAAAATSALSSSPFSVTSNGNKSSSNSATAKLNNNNNAAVSSFGYAAALLAMSDSDREKLQEIRSAFVQRTTENKQLQAQQATAAAERSAALGATAEEDEAACGSGAPASSLPNPRKGWNTSAISNNTATDVLDIAAAVAEGNGRASRKAGSPSGGAVPKKVTVVAGHPGNHTENTDHNNNKNKRSSPSPPKQWSTANIAPVAAADLSKIISSKPLSRSERKRIESDSAAAPQRTNNNNSNNNKNNNNKQRSASSPNAPFGRNNNNNNAAAANRHARPSSSSPGRRGGNRNNNNNNNNDYTNANAFGASNSNTRGASAGATAPTIRHHAPPVRFPAFIVNANTVINGAAPTTAPTAVLGPHLTSADASLPLASFFVGQDGRQYPMPPNPFEQLASLLGGHNNNNNGAGGVGGPSSTSSSSLTMAGLLLAQQQASANANAHNAHHNNNGTTDSTVVPTMRGLPLELGTAPLMGTAEWYAWWAQQAVFFPEYYPVPVEVPIDEEGNVLPFSALQRLRQQQQQRSSPATRDKDKDKAGGRQKKDGSNPSIKASATDAANAAATADADGSPCVVGAAKVPAPLLGKGRTAPAVLSGESLEVRHRQRERQILLGQRTLGFLVYEKMRAAGIATAPSNPRLAKNNNNHNNTNDHNNKTNADGSMAALSLTSPSAVLDLEIPSDCHAPPFAQPCSKRSWDGQVRRWRNALHKLDKYAELFLTPEEISRFPNSVAGVNGVGNNKNDFGLDGGDDDEEEELEGRGEAVGGVNRTVVALNFDENDE